MQRALLRGASTAEAARFALEQLPSSAPDGALPADPVTSLEVPPPDSARARRLRNAALTMDAGATQQALAEAIAAMGVLTAWEGLIEPVLTALRAGWHGMRAGPEVDYLLAECVLSALVRATPVPDSVRNERPVLLCLAPGEHNGLPLYALAACLAERRIGTQLFGRPLPADVLAATIRRCAPAAVVLRAQRDSAADVRLFADDPRGRPSRRLFAWGPGWARTPLPTQIELLPGLRATVDRLEYVLVGK